jgi:DNA-binding GntR family transcriptional regulator
LRQAIRDGTLVQNVLYSVNDVAETLDMSRTPVREALIELTREGFVEVVSQRGFRLRDLTDSQRAEVFDLRSVIESRIAELLAACATEDHIKQLRVLIDRQEGTAGNAEHFLAVDEEFHLLMPRLLGLERFHHMLTELRGAMWLIGSTALSVPERIPAVLAEHRTIVDAIAAHDPAAAADAVRTHLDQTAAAVTAQLRAHPQAN